MEDFDTNIENYSIDDLIQIFNLEHVSKNTVISKANELISKYSKHSVREFFIKAKEKLLQFVQEENNIATHNKNTINKLIYINSVFRQHVVFDGDYSSITSPHDSIYSSTNFSFNLSSRLKNVLRLEFGSIQIPYTWYNIDEEYNTNFFYIDEKKIEIPSGNYTIESLIEAINTNPIFSGFATITYDINSCKAKIQGKSVVELNFVFFIEGENHKNNNLGWILGYRNTSYTDTYIQGETVIQLCSDQYFFLILEDFNNHRDNNDLITIYHNNTNIDIPSYFSNDLEVLDTTDNIPNYGQSVPRLITQAQQYTLNEIITARQNVSNVLKFPPTADVLAIIPVHVNDMSFGTSTYSYENNESINRTYFGEVDIDRMHIKLINQYGNVVNLNGSDWSFTMKSIQQA